MKNNKVIIVTAPALQAKFIFSILLIALFFTFSSQNPATAQVKRVALLSPPDSSLIYMNYRNNWANFITVSTNANMHAELEGIKNTSLTVHNQTDQLLNTVQVKIDYLTANGKTYKSETVTVNNISPYSGKTIGVPDSDKGVYAKMQITRIEAPSFNFCYPGDKKTASDLDPYYCK